MTIVDALKEGNINIRLDYQDRWLLWNPHFEFWEVCERKPHAKKTTLLVETGEEDAAVQVLLEIEVKK